MYIDTHAHLYASEFDTDQDLMLSRAKSAGIDQILLPNIDLDSIQVMHQLVNKDPLRYLPMMGLHPCSVDENYLENLKICKTHLDQRNYIAIGETGIDLYWDKTFFKQQQEAFKIQIDWAKQYQLPIVIHARDSFDEIFAILDNCMNDQLRGVFHCFSGNAEQAQHILQYKHFLLGIGGVVTFKNSGLDKALEKIDKSNLILETDAPYLAPVPFRGKRNESSYIPLIAEKLSEIYACSVSEIAKITSTNAERLFKISSFLKQ